MRRGREDGKSGLEGGKGRGRGRKEARGGLRTPPPPHSLPHSSPQTQAAALESELQLTATFDQLHSAQRRLEELTTTTQSALSRREMQAREEAALMTVGLEQATSEYPSCTHVCVYVDLLTIPLLLHIAPPTSLDLSMLLFSCRRPGQRA